MSIKRRREYTDNYTIIDRRALEDTRLTWAARGLLGYLLSKPDSWQVSVSHLMNEGEAGRDKIYSLLKELTTYGYAVSGRKRDESGKLGPSDYIITDFPPVTADTEQAPHPALPDTAQPDTANPTLVSTDIKQVLINNNWGECPDGVNPDAWELWSSYKGGKPKKATITLNANKLRKFSYADQMAMVEETVANQWKGLFPLKNKSKGTNLSVFEDFAHG